MTRRLRYLLLAVVLIATAVAIASLELVRAAVRTRAHPAAATLAAVEHGELAAEAAEDDLGRVFLLARLVGPFAGLQLALDVDLRALPQILLGHLGQPLVEDDDAVPFGALAPLAGVAVLPVLGGRDRKMNDLGAVLGAAGFRVATEIPDQDHLVDAACHATAPLVALCFPPGSGLASNTTRANRRLAIAFPLFPLCSYRIGGSESRP